MAVFGTVCLWGLACIGAFVIVAFVIGAVRGVQEAGDGKKAETLKPPVQIMNLRTIPRAEPMTDPYQPQVLQKTTLQVTTTKYVDPRAVPPKEISA